MTAFGDVSDQHTDVTPGFHHDGPHQSHPNKLIWVRFFMRKFITMFRIVPISKPWSSDFHRPISHPPNIKTSGPGWSKSQTNKPPIQSVLGLKPSEQRQYCPKIIKIKNSNWSSKEFIFQYNIHQEQRLTRTLPINKSRKFPLSAQHYHFKNHDKTHGLASSFDRSRAWRSDQQSCG